MAKLNLRLIKSLGAYTLLGFVPLAVSFFLIPLYTAYLSPAEYGILASANVMQTFTILFITLNIDGALAVFFFDYEEDAGRYHLLATTFLGVIGLTAVIVGILAVAGRPLFGALWSDLPFERFGWFIVVAALSQVAYSVLFCWYRAKERLAMVAGVSLGTTGCSLIGSIVAIALFRADAFGAVVGKMIGGGVGIAPFVVLELRHARFRLDLVLLRKLFAYGVPMSAYTIVLYLLFNGDRFLMQRLFTTADLGLYSLAAALVTPTEILLQAGQNAIQPIFYRKLAAKEPGVAREIANVYVALVLVNVVALVVLVLLGEPVLKLFGKGKYAGSSYFVAILAFAQVFRVQYNGYAFTMFFSKQARVFPMVSIVSLLGAAPIAYGACRLFGPLGVGIGVAAWKGIQMIATRQAMHRVDTVRVDLGASVPWAIAATVYVTVIYVVRWLRPELYFAVAGALGVVLALAASVFAFRYVKRAAVLPSARWAPAPAETT